MASQNIISLFSIQSGNTLAGAELRALSILSQLDKKLKVTVCFWCPEGPLTKMYHDARIETMHLGRVPFYVAVYRLWLILRKRKFNIVEIYGLRANIIGRLVCRLTGNRTVLTHQRSVDDWRTCWHVWLDRITSRWVTLYISNTHAADVRLQERERIPAEKIRVIQNGINPAPYLHARRGRVRQSSGTLQDTTVITCVANLRDVKGHIFLLQAMALLKKDYADFKLWLVGEGEMRTQIENTIRELNLNDHVTLLGQRADIPDILADSDIFVLASLWEGMPGTIMEAMAAGLPCVASDVGGIPELIVPEETGFLVPPSSSEDIAQKTLLLCRDSRLRKKMGAAARERIQAEFLLDGKVKEFQSLYQNIAGNN